MRNKLLLCLAILLLLGGLGMLLWPSLQSAALRRAEKRTIREFERYRGTITESAAPERPENDSPALPQESLVCAFPELWNAAVAYNERLAQTQPAEFSTEAWKTPPLKLSAYGWGQESFGFLTIPSADIEAPIYLGGSPANLSKGAAVLGQTSVPIGGESTNCVIAGHRTWDGIRYPFVGLEAVQVGDPVYLTNPWQTLNYRVIATEIIYPDNTEPIHIQTGRDLLTVFTCTYPNTRRVLVICERVTEEE